MTYDFNMDHDTDIKPIAKSEAHFNKWIVNLSLIHISIAGEFGRIMGWADKYRTMKVRTNADTPSDAVKARELGAEGIGLCRTEHMFFEGNRIDAFREMICSETEEEREAEMCI